MNWIEVEWHSWHCAYINMDEIYADCERMMEEQNAPITQVIDKAIDSYVATLDDVDHYSWTEDAQRQVKEVALEHFGVE